VKEEREEGLTEARVRKGLSCFTTWNGGREGGRVVRGMKRAREEGVSG